VRVELIERLEALGDAAAAELAAAGDEREVERLRVSYLGRKGKVTELLRALGSLPPGERPAVGAAANRVKERIGGLVESRAAGLAGPAASRQPADDLTLPARHRWRGGLHPITQVVEEVCEIFRDLGFARVYGPELETPEYNFTKLNTPLDHPAADAADTLYLPGGYLLRTHTSPMQARVMEKHSPPIRIVVPGMAYRRDPWDASHSPAFEQIEGLAVDEGITFGDFKATLSEFARRFFGPQTRTRFRPSFFPFTEPSAEVDVSCRICGGHGCSACKGTGWMEIMGAGMVDPAVFEAVGYDPERYTGFAFGMGPARIAMQRYAIPDIRMLYENDVRFLEQFR
jgi:phenylalanyl-tRNA synthetase alpha chain